MELWKEAKTYQDLLDLNIRYLSGDLDVACYTRYVKKSVSDADRKMIELSRKGFFVTKYTPHKKILNQPNPDYQPGGKIVRHRFPLMSKRKKEYLRFYYPISDMKELIILKILTNANIKYTASWICPKTHQEIVVTNIPESHVRISERSGSHSAIPEDEIKWFIVRAQQSGFISNGFNYIPSVRKILQGYARVSVIFDDWDQSINLLDFFLQDQSLIKE